MRVTKKLECPIDEAEIANAKNALTRLTVEHERRSNAEKERAGEERKELKAMHDEIVELARRAQQGVAMRDVKCEERVDVDRGKKIVIRLDTGKEVPELEEDYDAEKHEPLMAKARAGAKQVLVAAPAAAKKGGKGRTSKETAQALVGMPIGADGLVEVLDVEGKKRKVRPEIAEGLRRANREASRFVHGFSDNPNVELAMIVGEPVFGADASGNRVPLSAAQVKILREAFGARTGFQVHVAGEDVEIVGLHGGPMIPSAPPERATKKGAKKGGAAPKKNSRGGRKGAEARA